LNGRECARYRASEAVKDKVAESLVRVEYGFRRAGLQYSRGFLNDSVFIGAIRSRDSQDVVIVGVEKEEIPENLKYSNDLALIGRVSNKRGHREACVLDLQKNESGKCVNGSFECGMESGSIDAGFSEYFAESELAVLCRDGLDEVVHLFLDSGSECPADDIDEC
jgi:hypothetical protein